MPRAAVEVTADTHRLGRWSPTCLPTPSSSPRTAAGSRSASPSRTAWPSSSSRTPESASPRTTSRRMFERFFRAAQRHRAGDPGHRPRPCHLEGHRRRARGHPRRRERARPRIGVHGAASHDGAPRRAPGRLNPAGLSLRVSSAAVGESPKITDPLEALEAARASFDAGRRLHDRRRGGVRDPRPGDAGHDRRASSASTRRPRTGPLAGMVAGELIRSEVEVRTGRCETFAEAADAMARRRGSTSSRRPSGSATGWPPRARTRSPAGRTRRSSTRRTTTWSSRPCATWPGATTRSASTCTPASAAPTGRSRSRARFAACCPSCWPRRAARPGWRIATPTCTRPARRCSRSSSRAAGSPTAGGLGRVRRVRALPDRDAVDPRAHRDLVERAPAPGVPDRRDADLRRPARVRPGGGAGGADGRR